MAKTKWLRITQDITAQFEDYGGKIGTTILRAGMEIQANSHPKCVLLENGDVMWGLTRIPKEILARPSR